MVPMWAQCGTVQGMTKVLVKFRLNDAEVAQLDELAALESRSRSNLVAFVVSEWIADQLHLSEQTAGRSPEIITSGPEAGKSRPRKRGGTSGTPAAPVDTPAGGPPAGSTNAPGKPHRHRYEKEVAGTRVGRAGREYVTLACSCGLARETEIRERK